jgi:hypothetical protein
MGWQPVYMKGKLMMRKRNLRTGVFTYRKMNESKLSMTEASLIRRKK